MMSVQYLLLYHFLGGPKAKVRDPVIPNVNANGSNATNNKTPRSRNRKRQLSKQK